MDVGVLSTGVEDDPRGLRVCVFERQYFDRTITLDVPVGAVAKQQPDIVAAKLLLAVKLYHLYLAVLADSQISGLRLERKVVESG